MLKEHEIGYSCEELLGAKKDGLVKGGGIEYKCRWRKHNAEDNTWESADSVTHHWKRGGGLNSETDRRREAEKAMEEARRKGVEPFHFSV